MECSPTFILTSDVRATHAHTINESLEIKQKLSITKIKNTFKQVNIIAKQYSHSILVHKQRLENQQFVSYLHDPPYNNNNNNNKVGPAQSAILA